jgi:hypothetical protein
MLHLLLPRIGESPVRAVWQNPAFLFYTAGVESQTGVLCAEGHWQDNG